MVDTEFGLHELAIEDALHESQRPKLDRYATHLFLSAYAVNLDAERQRLDVHEIAVFITDQALITVRKDDGFDITPILARWDASPDLAAHGVGFCSRLLDHLVDANSRPATARRGHRAPEEMPRRTPLPDPGRATARSFQCARTVVRAGWYCRWRSSNSLPPRSRHG
jgi:hypothetical protein